MNFHCPFIQSSGIIVKSELKIVIQLLVICMNERILQFLDSLMGTFNRMCLAFKRCGFKSGSISFFFFFF